MIRLWEEHLKTLEPLASLGLNCGGAINEALKENDALKRSVNKKLKELKSALANV